MAEVTEQQIKNMINKAIDDAKARDKAMVGIYEKLKLAGYPVPQSPGVIIKESGK